jgi:GH15 family glucan-1,4-alpha-glucosidase
MVSNSACRPRREDGYAPIGEYAALGDGRTVALVASDGRIDWWPLPAMDSTPAFAAILDPEAGGFIDVRPIEAFDVRRRYVGDSNAVETTFVTASGSVKVTDALTYGGLAGLPWGELVRRVEAIDGAVRMRWEVAPGSAFDSTRPWTDARKEKLRIHVGQQVLAVHCVDIGHPVVEHSRIHGEFIARPDAGAAFLAVTSSTESPTYFPPPDSFAVRLHDTIRRWHDWSASIDADPRWDAAIRRSALALMLLFYAPTGAIAAAPTTSLPERIGGEKNWDYRYMWVRDASFTIDALIALGLHEHVHSAALWLLDTVAKSAPSIDVFYRLDGSRTSGQSELAVPGYRGSRPARDGNSAASQLQLGNFGDLLDTMWRYVEAGHLLDPRSQQLLADLADRCCDTWQQPDAGIWELHANRHYTISKIGCWTALDRACRLADAEQIQAAHRPRWVNERDAIKSWVDEHCWSTSKDSYAFYAGSEQLDAATLLAGRTGFEQGVRLSTTIDAIKAELCDGPLVYRYTGMRAEEGAFVACSFWLVGALAIAGRPAEARALMDECVGLTNDVGLLSEQIDGSTGAFLGNFPQGLSHLALINAASELGRVRAPAASGQMV